MNFKKCSKCNKVKHINNFSKSCNRKDGLQNRCKECQSIDRKNNRIKNYDIQMQKSKEYYIKNKNYQLDYSKKWFQENKNSVIKQRKERRNSSPIVKFKHNTRSLISTSFSRAMKGKYKKSKRTEEILGCTIPEFFNYIQFLFTEGMTLEKVGSEIHIDHIIPISLAKTEEEVIKLCHYTNLQPMWKLDNIKKSNKL